MIGRVKRKIVLYYKTKIKHQKINDIKIDEWRKAGIKIGDNCYFCSDLPVGRDSSLLEFGDNVLTSVGVLFLMHDAAPTTISNGKGTDYLGRIKVGNRCFIGARAIIMPGVTLADDTVVGAGSVVTHSINEPGYVICGNPAKIICTVQEYLEKNKDKLVHLDGMGYEEVKRLTTENPDVLLSRSPLKIS